MQGCVCVTNPRGLVLEEKPELKRVLEQRRLEQHREQELALRPPSDLETELRKRQQRLQEVNTVPSNTHTHTYQERRFHYTFVSLLFENSKFAPPHTLY